MARKQKHEDHINHEAWAIPYGDLITLLLAFFVVMYAISSINEGKFRVLSDSLQAAFRGAPKTLQPVQVGEKSRGSGADIAVSIVQQATMEGQPRQMLEAISVDDQLGNGRRKNPDRFDTAGKVIVPPALGRVADEIEKALAPLIDADMIAVRRHSTWVEVEIRTDILFASGVARLSDAALPPLSILADTLAKYPNPVRVEGHTDNRPINTSTFPSNWELSAARAASVVHLFARGGVDPARLAVIGLGEFRPAQSNLTIEGRNANRRVLIVILAGDQAPEDAFGEDRGVASEPAQPGESAQPDPAQAQPIAQSAAPSTGGAPVAAAAVKPFRTPN
ncbi:MAG TPA: flagellar motor protein MotD [Steroidobacteraceae bacterium]|nr:flagellar motor protein MotD [Steroidobacteraceae bacterium]